MRTPIFSCSLMRRSIVSPSLSCKFSSVFCSKIYVFIDGDKNLYLVFQAELLMYNELWFRCGNDRRLFGSTLGVEFACSCRRQLSEVFCNGTLEMHNRLLHRNKRLASGCVTMATTTKIAARKNIYIYIPART